MRIWEFTEDDNGKLIAPGGFPGTAVHGRAVALGYFDGVHQGHKKILNKLTSLAHERGIPSMVHTFSSLPKSKKGDGRDKSNSMLTTLSEKIGCFERTGLDETALFPFSESVSSMHAMDFLQNQLKELLGAKVIVAGEDYRFGRSREGNMELLTFWGQENGIEVFAVPPVMYRDKVISSTWIRECVRNGRISLANSLLGYPISYEGIVQQGQRLGRTLGFPTANIVIEPGKLIPAFGVYASVLYMNDEFYPSITSVGLRPTVNTSDFIPLVETMMYDHSMDIYGEKIRIFLISFMRPEYRFADVAALKEQVHKDMAEVRHYHSLQDYDYSNLLSGVI